MNELSPQGEAVIKMLDAQKRHAKELYIKTKRQYPDWIAIARQTQTSPAQLKEWAKAENWEFEKADINLQKELSKNTDAKSQRNDRLESLNNFKVVDRALESRRELFGSSASLEDIEKFQTIAMRNFEAKEKIYSKLGFVGNKHDDTNIRMLGTEL